MDISFWVSLHRPILKKNASNGLQMSSGFIKQRSYSIVDMVQSAWGTGLTELECSRWLWGAGNNRHWDTAPQRICSVPIALLSEQHQLRLCLGELWAERLWLFLGSAPLPFIPLLTTSAASMTSALAPLILFPPGHKELSALGWCDYL